LLLEHCITNTTSSALTLQTRFASPDNKRRAVQALVCQANELLVHPARCCYRLQDTLAKLQAENERLRRDNERFVRLIDSGEWGRGRLAELVSAGEVMRGERDALLKLIGSLRREFEAVAAAKGCQEDELRLLKEKMTVGVSHAGGRSVTCIAWCHSRCMTS
jgi:hypothetical protein